jgi:prevent-host-death family protein
MPIQYRTMKDLKEKTPSVLRAAQRGDVVITLRGEPKALLRQISRDELEGMQLLESKRVRQLLAQAISDVKAGRTVPLEELLERTVTRKAAASR